MRWPPRVFVLADCYLSFQLTGGAYRRALSSWSTLVDSPAEADITLVVGGPDTLDGALRGVPAIRHTYLIAVMVFEARNMEQVGIDALQAADEVWVPSLFCMEIFAGLHRRLSWVPHVVETPLAPSRPTAQEAIMLDALDKQTSGRFVFLCIISLFHKRKGLAELTRAYRALRQRAPHAALVVKSKCWHNAMGVAIRPGKDAPSVPEPGVSVVGGRLTAGGMAALWKRADALVSAHHSEGWGLSLSDAMARGVPVVATGYSGNLDFMTHHNSLLVHAQERYLSASETELWFATSMRWGAIMPEHLERQMQRICGRDGAQLRPRLAAQARADVAHFSRARVGRRMRRLIANIVRRVRQAGGLAAWRTQSDAATRPCPAPLSRE